MEYFAFALNNWFPKVDSLVSNSELFFEAIRCDELGDQVVARLEKIENAKDGHDWWNDKELIHLFDDVYKSGIVSLPKNPVDRIRWMALLCVLYAKQRQFSYGNVLIPPDYVPDDEIEDYEDRYGWDVVEKVIKFRARLLKKGWNSLL